MNKIEIMGRLTNDPELKQTQSGTTYSNFGVAVNRRFKHENGPDADFFNVTVWGKTAEFVNKWFAKGQPIAVIGRIEFEQYTDRNGVQRMSTTLQGEEVYFAGAKSETSTNGNAEDGATRLANDASANGFIVDESEDDLPF